MTDRAIFQSGAVPAEAGPRPHPRGGSLRSGGQTALIAALFASGVWLWLDPDAGAVLWLHAASGMALAAVLLPWLWGHVGQGLVKSERSLFTSTSCLLLAVWALLLLTGLVMLLPAFVWFVGWIWFPDRAMSGALSMIHLWTSWPAIAGLVLHLSMRHWRLRRP